MCSLSFPLFFPRFLFSLLPSHFPLPLSPSLYSVDRLKWIGSSRGPGKTFTRHMQRADVNEIAKVDALPAIQTSAPGHSTYTTSIFAQTHLIVGPKSVSLPNFL